MATWSGRKRRQEALLLSGVVGAALALAGSAQAGPVTTYEWTGPGKYSLTVPATGINAAVVDLYGAQGGYFSPVLGEPVPGGLGGHVQTRFSVGAGSQWIVTVGGPGGSVAQTDTGPNSCSASGGSGGVGGGGAGGAASAPGPWPSCWPGAGGGGATSITQAGGSRPLAVAGGGGGAAEGGAGGAGGGENGADASAGDDVPAKGATLSGPGAGARVFQFACLGLCVPGGDGHDSIGGAGGGVSGAFTATGGGGGGGGFYGGGGGSHAGGAGGSSSPAAAAAPDVNEAGVKSGNGQAVVTLGTIDTPTVTADTPPPARAGVAYSYTFRATGWPGWISFAVGDTPGYQLPPGLSLNLDGTLSGTPTQSGTFPVELVVYNYDRSITDTFSITVQPGPAAALQGGDAQSTRVGTAFPQNLLARVVDRFGNGVPGVTVHFELPASQPSGTFSTTGTTSTDATSNAYGYADAGSVVAGSGGGTYAVTVSAPGADLATATIALTNEQAPMFAGGAAPQARVGHAYSYRFQASGYPDPTVSLASGSLPPGLSLASDGTLSGTPTQAGTFAFTLAADNGVGTADSLAASVTVSATPAPVSASIGDASVAEGNRGLHGVAVVVTLSRRTSRAVVVRWRTANGTARAPSDYVAASGTLRIPAGHTHGVIGVSVRGDRIVEPDETFSVKLPSIVGAQLARAQGIVTIRNDD